MSPSGISGALWRTACLSTRSLCCAQDLAGGPGLAVAAGVPIALLAWRHSEGMGRAVGKEQEAGCTSHVVWEH